MYRREDGLRFDDAKFSANVYECIYSQIDVFWCVSRAYLNSDSRFSSWHHGITEADHVNTFA